MKILFRVFAAPHLEREIELAAVPHAGDRVSVTSPGLGSGYAREFRVETVTHIANVTRLHVATIDCVELP